MNKIYGKQVNFLEQSKTSAGISAESAAKARSEISITRRYFADMLILMVVPAVMAWYYYCLLYTSDAADD